MTPLALDSVSSWLLVAAVLVAAGMVGLAIIHDGQRARRQAARDVRPGIRLGRVRAQRWGGSDDGLELDVIDADIQLATRTEISPGELRRREWLLGELDRDDLTVEERQGLNQELTLYSPPWEHLREAAL